MRYITHVAFEALPVKVTFAKRLIERFEDALCCFVEVLGVYAKILKWPYNEDGMKVLAAILIGPGRVAYKQIALKAGTGFVGILAGDPLITIKSEALSMPDRKIYGMFKKNGPPYEVTVNNVGPAARLQLALVHELVHVMEYASRVKVSEETLHQTAGIIASEVLPMVELLYNLVPQGEKDVIGSQEGTAGVLKLRCGC